MKRTEEARKKPYRSAASNMLWSARRLIRSAPLAFCIVVLLIPVDITLQYLQIYLPALVVGEVTAAKPAALALRSVGLATAGIFACSLITTALERVKDGAISRYRYEAVDALTRKALSMPYQDFEKKSMRDLYKRAQKSTWMWDGRQPLIDMITNGFGVIKNVLGYLLFGTMISFASPWLVPLLTIAPIVNWMALRAYNNWEYSVRPQTSAIDRQFDYIQKQAADFACAKDIRIYSLAGWLRACFQDLCGRRAAWDRKTVVRKFFARAADLVVILVRDAGAYALLISMFARGEITADRFVLYFAAISSFASWVGGVIECWNGLHSISLSLCDLREFLEFPETDGTGEARADEHMAHAPEIAFENVCFRYEGAQKDTLHNLSFTLHAGEKLALVGLNGAGKTTIVKLACGLYRPTSGTIRLDGAPVDKFRRKDYFRLFSPVFQQIRTAFFTLAEHVSGRTFEETDLARAEDCLRRAGLGRKLDALPDGLRTCFDKQLNERAVELSGGEAQKLMLARALYKDAPVLILDEPTAALDPIAESEIYTEYNEMAQDKTSLFISHRLASTAFCDRILYLENGRVLEEGTHAQLLAQGGKYRELFEIQSCWYTDGKETAK